MMQHPINPQLIARLMQMRQSMHGGNPQQTPIGNPMEATQMLSNQSPLNNTGPNPMTMGQPNPELLQQLMARRRAMLMAQSQPPQQNNYQQGPGISPVSLQPSQTNPNLTGAM